MYMCIMCVGNHIIFMFTKTHIFFHRQLFRILQRSKAIPKVSAHFHS